MGRPVPPVDLSNGKYDEFEIKLSEMLGIKVILIRDWETPESYRRAESETHFAHTQEELDKAQEKFAVVEEATLAQLRANIVDRDPEIGHALNDNSLRSLLNVWHVTHREGNADPEQAVIIFDPGRSSAHRPDVDPVINYALTDYFTNTWCDISKAMHDKNYKEARHLDVKDLIENFDLSAEDVRRYRAIQNVTFALANQSEYNNIGRKWYYEPHFYIFAGIAGEDSPQINQGTYDMPYDQVCKKFLFDLYATPEDWGIKDPEFFDKIRLAGAIMNLHYGNLLPQNTFARLDCSDVTRGQIAEIQENLRKRIKKQVEKHKPKQADDLSMTFYHPEDDWRVLFPVFREIYEKDKSIGPEREYLDTIMAGLQRFFPTITNAPVPKLEEGKEPPRTLPKQTQAAKPQQRKPAL